MHAGVPFHHAQLRYMSDGQGVVVEYHHGLQLNPEKMSEWQISLHLHRKQGDIPQSVRPIFVGANLTSQPIFSGGRKSWGKGGDGILASGCTSGCLALGALMV